MGGNYIKQRGTNIDFHKDIKPLDLSMPHNKKNKFKNGKSSKFCLSENPNKHRRINDNCELPKINQNNQLYVRFYLIILLQLIKKKSPLFIRKYYSLSHMMW